ncbi:extracellular solute-binding protein [Candidatus Wolfebacteria bacterium]|nr:extracellular solute-binding protein [Candidatus Wolfebacteria bacterium]
MPLNLSRNQLIIIFAVFGVVLFFILVFLGVIPGLKKSGSGGLFGQGKQITLSFWGVENSDFFMPFFENYQKIQPNLRIDYKQISENDYEKTLINALAAGRGPDIMMFYGNWLPKHADKIIPVEEGQFPFSEFQQLFPTVAVSDFAPERTVYALPLFIDTLAFLYNKNIFDAKAVALPPTSWNDFQNLVPKFNEVGPGPNRQVIKSAASIGGSEKSVHAAGDLLNVIMLQFGSQLISQKGQQINFSDPEEKAFDFYLQFSNPVSRYYTWSDNLPYSLNAFAEGQTAAIFDYASQIPLLKKKSPFLEIGVSFLPQLNPEKPINFAGYWGLAVSKNSRDAAYGWDFIIRSLGDQKTAEKYLEVSRRPPALRTLIQKYSSDPDLGVFARQALTARSWPQPDNNKIKQIFSNMIELVLTAKLSPREALQKAENELNELH